mmetsp:Transcript_5541/g.23524  ORF Transcript_5541/g.23524 Transcript_5541/m.23524 type:complete len:93 (-) Transcript_5541:3300-3578(-)
MSLSMRRYVAIAKEVYKITRESATDSCAWHLIRPKLCVETKLPNENNWRGTEVKVTIQGSWTTYRAKILQYMRQMAVITPYAQFNFKFNTPR